MTPKSHGHPSIQINVVSCSIEIMEYIKTMLEIYFPYIYHNNDNAKIHKRRDCSWYNYTVSGLRAAVILDYMLKLNCPSFDRKLNNPKINECLNWYYAKYPQYFQ